MVPLAPSFRDSTLHSDPLKGGSNWATSPCSRYRSPPEVELSNIWLDEQLAKKEPEYNNGTSLLYLFVIIPSMFTFILTLRTFTRP